MRALTFRGIVLLSFRLFEWWIVRVDAYSWTRRGCPIQADGCIHGGCGELRKRGRAKLSIIVAIIGERSVASKRRWVGACRRIRRRRACTRRHKGGEQRAHEKLIHEHWRGRLHLLLLLLLLHEQYARRVHLAEHVIVGVGVRVLVHESLTDAGSWAIVLVYVCVIAVVVDACFLR